jgi:hypothetical protein
MMKILTKAALAATVATGLFAAPAFAANSDMKPFTAKATIIKPLTLTNTGDLDFGTITMGAALSSSNVVVGRSGGVATTSCGANLTCSAPSAATFGVTGVALQTLNVTLGTVSPLVNTSDNTKTVSFSADPDATVSLDAAGAGSFDIGGSITVLAATADGNYTGTVDVTVAYP